MSSKPLRTPKRDHHALPQKETNLVVIWVNSQVPAEPGKMLKQPKNDNYESPTYVILTLRSAPYGASP